MIKKNRALSVRPSKVFGGSHLGWHCVLTMAPTDGARNNIEKAWRAITNLGQRSVCSFPMRETSCFNRMADVRRTSAASLFS